MHPLRLAAALPMGALALTLAATPAAAWPAHEGRGHAQGSRAESRAPGTVAVTGRGESTVAPDMAVITLGVTVQAPSATEAMRRNTQQQQVVIDTLKARGIEARDIQTSGLNLTPVQDYSREGQPPVITGYQATNMVTVRVRDLPRLGEALDALVEAGANEIHGIGFQRENIEDAEGEARARAVENARLRAEIMANAAGMELGRLVAISDLGGQQGPQPMMRAMAMDAAAQSAPVPVEAGELSVAAEVSVTWELRPARRGDGPRGDRRDWRGGHSDGGHGMGPQGMHGLGVDHSHHGHHDMEHGGMGMDGMPMHRGMEMDAKPGGQPMAPGAMDRRGSMMPSVSEGGAGVEADAAAAAADAPAGASETIEAPVAVGDQTAGATAPATAAPAAAGPSVTPPVSQGTPAPAEPSSAGEAIPSSPADDAASAAATDDSTTEPSVTPPSETPAGTDTAPAEPRSIDTPPAPSVDPAGGQGNAAATTAPEPAN